MAPVADEQWQPIRDYVGDGLTKDEWLAAARRLPPGSIVEGTVLACLPMGFGVTVGRRLVGQVEVISIIDERRPLTSADWPAVGTVVKAKVLDLSVERRRIRLSIRPSDLLPTG